MSPDLNLKNIPALFENLRGLKSQLVLDLLLLISLDQDDLLPKDWAALNTYINRLKTRNKSDYETAIEMMARLDENETISRLSTLGKFTKSKYFDQNRKSILITFINGLASNSGFISDMTLSEFIIHFVATKYEGKISSIFDPAFGLGSLVFSAFSGSKGPDFEYILNDNGDEVEVMRILCKKVFGTEINSEISKLANRLGQSSGFETDIKNSDALILDLSSSSKHEMVVCEPPAGMRLSENHLRQDWPFGRPPKSSADWAWAQVIHAHIAKNGYGFMFVPTGALFRSNHGEVLIRAKMVNAGVIKALINLPSGLAASHSLKLSLIIFGTGKELNLSDKEILFIDIDDIKERKGTHQYVSSLLNKIHNACDEFEKFEQGKFKNTIGYTASLKRNDPELLKNDMNLNPSRYVTKLTTGVNIKFSINKNINQISKKVQEVAALIDKAEKDLSTFSIKAEFINLGDLIASKKIINVLGTSKNDLKSNQIFGVKYDADTGDRLKLGDKREALIKYISVDDIRQQGKLQPSGVLRPDIISKENSLIYTETNDVIFIKTGKPAAKVDTLGKNVLLSPLSALRITEAGRKIVSPEILAFVLNGERVKKFIQGTTIGRLMIESIPIPIMDTMNAMEINQGLDLIQRLLMRSNDLNAQLVLLEQRLSSVLAGEFDGLGEEQ